MIDNVYKNSFKEVYDILQNTDEELVHKIPKNFMDFIKNNMDTNYKTNIDPNIEIDKQTLLKETESILSLIYKSYWATDQEKNEFAKLDKLNFIESEKNKNEAYSTENLYEIFEKRKNLNNISLNQNLIVVEKESFFKKIINKILNLFKK